MKRNSLAILNRLTEDILHKKHQLNKSMLYISSWHKHLPKGLLLNCLSNDKEEEARRKLEYKRIEDNIIE